MLVIHSRRMLSNLPHLGAAIVAAALIGAGFAPAAAAPSSSLTVKITSPLGRMGTSGKVRIVAQIQTAPETLPCGICGNQSAQ